MNWFRITGGVAIGILALAMIWGDYQYYFNKPIPVINNNTFQPGSNPNIKQGSQQRSGGLNVGVVAGPVFIDGNLGGFIGTSVSYAF